MVAGVWLRASVDAMRNLTTFCIYLLMASIPCWVMTALMMKRLVLILRAVNDCITSIIMKQQAEQSDDSTLYRAARLCQIAFRQSSFRVCHTSPHTHVHAVRAYMQAHHLHDGGECILLHVYA